MVNEKVDCRIKKVIEWDEEKCSDEVLEWRIRKLC